MPRLVLKAAPVLLMGMSLLVSFYAHRMAGLTLPVPWNDEAWHVWEGHAMARDWSLLAPEINPDRPTVFKGHGYSLYLGVVFRLFGFSLETARWASWVASAGVYMLLCLLVWRFPYRLVNILVISLFFLGPPYVVAGNVAREDSLALFMAALAFVLFQRDMPFASTAVAALGVTVHPNVLYFFLAIFLCAVAIWMRQSKRPAPFEWWILLPCVAGVLMSGIFVLRHWDFFLADFFGPGLSVQAARDPLRTIAKTENLLKYAWFVALFGASYRWERGWLLVLIFGFCCLLPPILNQEMWYAIYRVTADAVLYVVSIHFLAKLIGALLRMRSRAPTEALALLIAIPFLEYSRARRDIEGPVSYPRDMEWRGGGGMAIQDPNVPWITDEDIRRVSELILTEIKWNPDALIEFNNLGGDSVFFKDALKGYRFLHPVYTRARGEVIVFRISRYQPLWVRDRLHQYMASFGIDPAQPDYVRDETEKWFIQRVPEAERE